MAILRLALIILVLGACYAPELADCVVSCTTDTECAGDQACTPQGKCAGGGATCEDAPATVELHVRTMGDGHVEVEGAGACGRGTPSDDEDCRFDVQAGPVVLHAIPNRQDKPFERWMSLVCAGQDATCSVTLSTNASVVAKFR